MRRRGFTFIEISVVVFLIILLSSLVDNYLAINKLTGDRDEFLQQRARIIA